MTAKMLQHNGKGICRSMYWPLTVEKRAEAAVQQDMATFKETAGGCLGAKLTNAKLEEVGVPEALVYVPYTDEYQNETTFPDLDEEIMPEVVDEYVHA